ncbi:MAG: glycosyltransferase family 4 protein [Candidatus Pacebacteria bacterium]|nr:glycosyltransferase family 4 protein [Candidatus Paceibacterota bacterium]
MKKLKIAFYSTNEFSCPLPKEIIYAPMDLAELVVKELDRRGHDVTLYTSEDSKIEMKKVTAGMISYYKLKNKAMSGGFHDQLQMTLYEQLLASKMYEDSQKGKFDIIHAYHLVPKILPFVNLTKTPTVFTLHDPMNASWNKMINFCQWKNKANYISISDNQRKGMPKLNYVKTVYNGLDLSNFKFQKEPQGYLAFLGRYSKEKGIDTAVQVAIKSKEKLKMAGNIWGGGFYDEKVKPFLKKDEVEDIGFLSRKKLSSFLGGAKALLFPINWEEPFGLVMIEAMASGTPVIAFNRGSVSEVVKHGKTGFVVENEKEMIEAIKKIDQIKREDCRAHVEENFTIKTMVDGYEEAYQRVLKKK